MTNHTGMTEAVVNRHLQWMQARHLSPNSVQARRVALRSLSAFLGGPILYATHNDLQAWQLHTAARVGTSTLRGYLSNVREFYGWALDDQLIATDPTTKLRGPAAPKYLPRPLPDDDFERAMAAAPPDVRVILGLARWAGLRATEIASLDWQDVNLRLRTLRVRGKGRKERQLPIATSLATLLREQPGARRGPVVRRRDDGTGRNRPHRISQLANTHLHALGIPETLHTLRHADATALLDASGGDLRLVQEFLGHESPGTTSIYTRVSTRKLRDAVEAAARLHVEADTA